MSAAASSPAGLPLWGARRGPWFLIAVHIPFVATPPALLIGDLSPSPAEAGILVLLALLIGGIQLRHSLATARGVRPAGWRWSLGALVVLSYLPLWWWFSWTWVINAWWMEQLFVAASAAMLLRGLAARILFTVPVLGPVLASAAEVVIRRDPSAAFVASYSAYQLAVFVIFPATLYWSARLVRTIDELFATRVALAESAIAGERQRISRDLHDVLGQSLSAVSLKGDLAIRLLAVDRNAALTEIDGLTEAAQDALKSVRAVALAQHRVSFRGEVDGAVALLSAAGVDTRTRLELPRLKAPVETLLAWAIREGATNMLRHSEARTCWIDADDSGGTIRLSIVNDGARASAGEGSGIRGLAERARVLSGSVTAELVRGQQFRLALEVPAETE